MSFIRKTKLYILAIPLLFLVLGSLSNQAVLWANHDTFPVLINIVKAEKIAPDAIQLKDGTILLDDVHCLMTPHTHLNFLADIFDLDSSVMSIGDLSLILGEWLWGFAPIIWFALVVQKLYKIEEINKGR